MLGSSDLPIIVRPILQPYDFHWQLYIYAYIWRVRIQINVFPVSRKFRRESTSNYHEVLWDRGGEDVERHGSPPGFIGPLPSWPQEALSCGRTREPNEFARSCTINIGSSPAHRRRPPRWELSAVDACCFRSRCSSDYPLKGRPNTYECERDGVTIFKPFGTETFT